MADVNANIGVHIDTSDALAQLKSLQRQISQFHTSIAKSSEAAALAQRDLQRNFLNSVNALGTFSAELRNVKTTSESFTSSLEKNKFSMREYFRYAGASTQTFGKLFKSEFDTISKVAEDRVKRLQTQYIKMGRDANGAMKAIAIMPNELDMSNLSTQMQLAAQKQALFNQLMKQGSTNLLNFGKNTQWAGRQLMVGFTLPLMAAGTAAAKSFMQMEAQALKFKKVYGDLFTPQAETQQALDDIQALAKEFTKYGIAVADTVGLAADAAAAGFKGIDLQRQTAQATRLAVLGQIDQNKALETTISLQNAFGISSAELAQNIDFLNAVENQTVTSLDDITTAIPKVAPVIKQLGGDVKDLAFFLTAMKEGGVNASEGANALKSGLASLINPSNKARQMLEGLGIDIVGIVNKDKGNLKKTVVDFAMALDQLAPLQRARAIEQMFGKFQFARLSALFSNVTKDGTQAARVLELAGSSVQDLANLSNQELGKTADSAMNKFKKSVEDLKVAIVPVGEAFLKTVTPIIEFISKIADKFSGLSEGTKKAITVMVTVIGGLGPILLMTFGLLANGVANIIKLFLTLRNGYLRLTGQSQNLGEQTQYLTSEQLDAAAAAHSLNQAHATLTQQFTVETAELQKLIAAYQAAISAATRFASINPGMMVPPRKPQKFANNGIVRGPGGPKDDRVPIMASNGEAIIDAETVNNNREVINQLLNNGTYNSVSEEFISTRVGRNASGGEKAQVNIPGGYQLGHFAEPIKMTGAELTSLVEKESKNVQFAVKKLISSVGGNLNTIFDVFTNQITVQSKELNQALGEVGSGKRADIKMFKKESVNYAGAYNAPLIREMQKAGATTDEVETAVKQLANEFSSGIKNLGKVTTVTAEDVNNITKTAYDKVAATNEKVKQAQIELQKLGAIKEKTGVTSGRVSFAGAYNTSTVKKGINEVVQQQAPGLYPTQQAFNFTGEAARKVGIQNAKAIRMVFDQLDEEAKARVFALVGDIDKVSKQVIAEAQNAGIDIGKYTISGIAKGTESASDSKKAIQEGKNVTNGFVHAIQNGKNEALVAGKQLGDAGVTGIKESVKKVRRVATRPQGPSDAANMTAARSARTRRVATRPQGSSSIATPVLLAKIQADMIAERQRAEELSRAQEKAAREEIKRREEIALAAKKEKEAREASTARLGKLNNAIQSGSFALMSISGITQMFGGRFSGLADIVFKVSGAMFALQTVTQMVTQTQLLSAAASKANTVATGLGFLNFKALAKTIKDLVTAGSIVAALKLLGSTISRSLGTWGKLIGTLLIAIGTGIGLYKAQEKAKEKTEAFARALETTADQIKSLSGYFGITPTTSPLQSKKGFAPGSPAQLSEMEKFRQSDAFKQYGEPTAKSLKYLTDKQAVQVLNAKMFELLGAGFSKEQIQIIIGAIQQEAGKTDLKINFDSVSFDKLPEQILSDFDKQIQKFDKLGKNVKYKVIGKVVIPIDQSTEEYKKAAPIITKYLDAISAAFKGAQITGKQFSAMFDAVVASIGKIPDKANQIALVNAALAGMESPAAKSAIKIKDLSDKLLVLKAVSLGLSDQITEQMISSLNYIGTDPILSDIKKRTEETIKKLIADRTAIMEKFNKAYRDSLKPGGPGADTLSKQSKLAIALMEKELDLLKTKRDTIKDANDELKRQKEYQESLLDLQKKAVEAKIRGDYIGASILEQQKGLLKTEFNKETESISLDKRITALENAISGIKATNKVTAAQQALVDSIAKGGGTPIKKAMGGQVKYYEPGGKVDGPGTGTSDSIPAYLSNGEYVVRAAAVDQYGVELFDGLNAQKFAKGGLANNSSNFDKIKNKLISDLIERLKLSPNEIKRRRGQQTEDSIKKIIKSLGFANGGIARFAMGGEAVGGKKPLNTYQKFMLDMANNAGFVDKFFGLDAIFRTASGQSSKGDKAIAGLSLLPGMGLIGKSGKFASKSGSMLSKISRLWKTPAKPVAPVIESMPTSTYPAPHRSGPGAPPPLPIKPSNDWDTWYDTNKFVYKQSNYRKLIGNLYNERGYLGKGLANLITGIATPFNAARRLMGGIKTPLELAYKYGSKDKNQKMKFEGVSKLKTLFDARNLGYKISNPLLSIFDKIGQKTYPKRIIEGLISKNKEYKDSPFLAKMMIKRQREPSYANIPKNIALDAKEKISSGIKNKIGSIMGVIDNKASSTDWLRSSSGIKRNLAMAALYSTNAVRKKEYLKQALFDSIPGGPGALFQILRGVHRSNEPLTELKSPLERAIGARLFGDKIPSNAFGPGLYSATSKIMSDQLFTDFGGYAYKGALNKKAMLKILFSKGFVKPGKFEDKLAEKLGFPLSRISGMQHNIDNPYIQALMKKGYIGYRHADAFTNWLTGSMPGVGLKLIETPMGAKTNPITGVTDLFNDAVASGDFPKIIMKARGGYIGMPKFNMGGIAKNFNIPSYDSGINYVPQDTLAMIHQGERVMTEQENKAFTNNAQSINNTNNIYINGTDLSKKEIADEVMVRLEKVQKQNNKSNMVVM